MLSAIAISKVAFHSKDDCQKSPSFDISSLCSPSLHKKSPKSQITSSNVPNENLSGGVLLVVVLDGLDARISDEELVPEATNEAEGDALHGGDDEAAEGRSGAESTGLAGQRTGPVEGGVAVDDAGHDS